MNFSSFSPTTEVLSSLATLGLKACLARWESIQVRVVSRNFLNLLSGQVDEVEIAGQGWQSLRGLTCRTLAVRTQPIQVDIGAAVGGKIILKRSSLGTAQISLNGQDFNNFLKSVLIKDCLARLIIDGEPLTQLFVDRLEKGVLHISGEWCRQRFGFELRAGQDGKAFSSGDPQPLGQGLADFFNHLVIDLQGLELKMESFRIDDTILHLKANARIWQFPQKAVTF
jgi:hypothetical protein